MNGREIEIDREAIDRIDIDQIVRAVLERLGRREGADRLKAEQSNGNKTQRAEEQAQPGLVLTGRVITRADLEGQIDGLSVVTAERGAVVTPAARDYLRENKIALSYGLAPSGNGSPKVQWTLGLADTTYDPAPLLNALGTAFNNVQRLARSGLETVIDELADATVHSGHLGLLLTHEALAAVCMANRLMGVRATLGVDVNNLTQAVAGIGCNFLIIDPAGKSLFQMRQLVKEFCRGGARRCPAKYRQRLG